MSKIRGMLTYLVILAVSYYVLPLSIVDGGSRIIVLLVIQPLFCMAIAIMYGIAIKRKKPKHVASIGVNSLQIRTFIKTFSLYAFLSGILFLPTIYFYLDATGFLYLIIYMGLSFIGCLIGHMLQV